MGCLQSYSILQKGFRERQKSNTLYINKEYDEVINKAMSMNELQQR